MRLGSVTSRIFKGSNSSGSVAIKYLPFLIEVLIGYEC